MTAALLVTALVSGGLFLLLQRGWVRRTLGFVLLSHAVNVLLLAAGRGAGREVPFVGGPGPQAGRARRGRARRARSAPRAAGSAPGPYHLHPDGENVYLVLSGAVRVRIAEADAILDGVWDELLVDITVDPAKAQQDYARLLGHGEQVHAAFLLIRDTILFTDRRLILVDKQGLKGTKADYQTIPYKSINRFSKESAGVMDSDAELKIWIKGETHPIKKQFGKNDNVNEIYKILSKHVL